jgi:hypothetical protein
VEGGGENEREPHPGVVGLRTKEMSARRSKGEKGGKKKRRTLNNADFVKNNTPTPISFVAPIPLITDAPTSSSAAIALSSRSFPPAGCLNGNPPPLAPTNALARCALNSTAIPTLTARLVSERGLREMDQTPMTPRTVKRERKVVKDTTVAVRREPRRREVTRRTARRASVRTSRVVDQRVASVKAKTKGRKGKRGKTRQLVERRWRKKDGDAQDWKKT